MCIRDSINADAVAGAVAGALRARRLIMLTDVAGVLDPEGKLIQSCLLYTSGEQVALDAFAGNVGGTLLRAAGELVDFVDKHDAHLLHALTGEIGDLVLVHELGGLILDEMCIRDSSPGAPFSKTAEMASQ